MPNNRWITVLGFLVCFVTMWLIPYTDSDLWRYVYTSVMAVALCDLSGEVVHRIGDRVRKGITLPPRCYELFGAFLVAVSLMNATLSNFLATNYDQLNRWLDSISWIQNTWVGNASWQLTANRYLYLHAGLLSLVVIWSALASTLVAADIFLRLRRREAQAVP